MGPQSLTEDLEFSAKLVLEGGKVNWNEWAITYDENPSFTAIATVSACGGCRGITS